MSREQMFAAIVLFGLLAIAVVGDLRRHRIANLLILSGLALGLSTQVHASGIAGLGSGALGLLVGFGVFLPLYALGGMAAGDVKLMAMVGSFLSPQVALWAALFSLIAGALCGFLLILARGQLSMTLSRYWLMLRARGYMAPAEDEVAGKPFPYSVAILLGTLGSGYFILLRGGL
ncbi:MAG: prepilin peptidase [Pseudomonas sp.]|uniref:A24 family peptidase n=1 Tax=Pseudomonas sp. TaxID=306 RepID=UPI003BB5F84C